MRRAPPAMAARAAIATPAKAPLEPTRAVPALGLLEPTAPEAVGAWATDEVAAWYADDAAPPSVAPLARTASMRWTTPLAMGISAWTMLAVAFPEVTVVPLAPDLNENFSPAAEV